MAGLRGYENFDDTYRESIKSSVNNGTFFHDGWDFFSVVYLRTITDRSFYIFIAIIAAFICYNTVLLIDFILPLKEDVYITIKEKDITKYSIFIKDLSKNKDADTTNEHVLRYLLMNYVKEREEHDYRSGKIADINAKLLKIYSNSSPDITNEFRNFMSQSNRGGPFYYLGNDIQSMVEITNFKFRRIVRSSLMQKIKDWLFNSLLPIGADVYYDLIIEAGDGQVVREKRRAYIEFSFVGVEKSEKGDYLPVKFMVTQYKNYLVKK
ncbi:MAG: type IV secretion system protein [Rickettsiales bacterium]|jgi:type IV secretory pathway component VirB8|nr:type IV secretion system protein [Rickettsiales bacterium]